MNHKIIIVVNKIDRPDARLDEIGDEVLELLLDLDANDDQLKVLYFSVRAGQVQRLSASMRKVPTLFRFSILL